MLELTLTAFYTDYENRFFSYCPGCPRRCAYAKVFNKQTKQKVLIFLYSKIIIKSPFFKNIVEYFTKPFAGLKASRIHNIHNKLGVIVVCKLKL